MDTIGDCYMAATGLPHQQQHQQAATAGHAAVAAPSGNLAAVVAAAAVAGEAAAAEDGGGLGGGSSGAAVAAAVAPVLTGPEAWATAMIQFAEAIMVGVEGWRGMGDGGVGVWMGNGASSVC